MLNLCFDEESDCSEKNTCDKEVLSFALLFLYHFSLILSRKKRVVIKAMRKQLNITADKSRLEHEESILPSSFYGHPPDYFSHVFIFSV